MAVGALTGVEIVPPTIDHAEGWVALRNALWPEGADDQREEVLGLIEDGDPDLFQRIAIADGVVVGFVEAALRRDYVNGCDTSPVVFLEGIFVAADHRRRGIARALSDAVGAWGRAQGCTEFASDAVIDNQDSQAFHARLGFAETERVVYFRRAL